jgi:4-hydroxyphenylacetate 3-monooxygenase
MPARTGAEFLDRLSRTRTHVEIQGETLQGGVADHPAFKNVVRTYAGLFDLQQTVEYRNILTYPSPATGDRVATSFLIPRTAEDLAKRSRAYKVWADASCGMLGRTGDYLNSALMAHIVREDDNGIVVRGARMLATIGPFADELLVFPSTVLRGTTDDKPYSFAFAIPTDAPGLRFIAREPFDYGRSHFDHPLGSRFDESDAVVVFDDVHVPYERCFTLGDPEICNGFYTKTDAVAHMTHQVVARTTAKTEFILGLTTVLTEAIGIGGFQHVQADLAEIITTLETLRALNRAAEADAQTNAHQVFTPAWPPLNAARNLYPKLYQRFPEILRKLGASGLMATPTEADVDGPAAGDIDAYLQAATLTGRERVRLFRLVWDACASAFAGRQALYEYYFFGDPVRMATAYQASYDKAPYADRVKAFLASD